MAEGVLKELRVFRPKSLGGTLRLYTRNPGALLYAGGTEIARQAQRGSGRPLDLPQKVIYLGNVQELNRISRAQRYLDIGSVLDLSRILSIGRNVLPPVLFESLEHLVHFLGCSCTGDTQDEKRNHQDCSTPHCTRSYHVSDYPCLNQRFTCLFPCGVP